MSAIYKYPLLITDVQIIELPVGAIILSAQVQRETLCVWAMVEQDTSKYKCTIEIIGTGHPMSDARRRYIGTAQMAGGSLVWHVFERY